jgi:hypothetical protein
MSTQTEPIGSRIYSDLTQKNKVIIVNKNGQLTLYKKVDIKIKQIQPGPTT